MAEPLLGPDRVLLLLSLVPYLREHGPTPVEELAASFDVDPRLLRRLVRFLGTSGIPGETLTYQHEDLFDIDWDALEQQDIVSLTHSVAVDDAPRFSRAETAALIAGLQSLTTMLGPRDVELARETAEKLGAALGAGESAPALSVTADPQDPRVPLLVSALESGRSLRFEYRDTGGATTRRRADPLALSQHGTIWYLRAYCHDRRAERTFRVDHMREVEVVDPVDGSTGARPESAEQAPQPAVFDLIARVSTRVLPRLIGFEPEILQSFEASQSLAEGEARIRIEAWHAGAAVRLVQFAPGEVTIESPPAARAAVREWVERALARR